MNNRNTLIALVAATLLSTSITAHATVIASTDFDGRVVNGDTAQNLTWVTSGIANLGDLTAYPVGSIPQVFTLFDTPDTQDKFAADRNINDEGDWAVDLDISVLSGNDISLSTIDFDSFIVNNNGADQPVQRLLNVSLDILDSGQTSLFSDSILNVFNPGGALVNGTTESLSFDVSSVILSAGLDYTFRITSFGDLNVSGNNAGIDNLVVNGELSPVQASGPAMLGLLMLGGLSLVARKKIMS